MTLICCLPDVAHIFRKRIRLRKRRKHDVAAEKLSFEETVRANAVASNRTSTFLVVVIASERTFQQSSLGRVAEFSV